MTNNYCVIMAGGIGSRFWPMSRNAHPKQFIDILGSGKTLIRQTFERFRDTCPPENIYVITSDTYVSLVKKQLPEIADANIIAEPQRRNTAPCVIYSAFKIAALNPDANIVVAPSDHLVTDTESFREAVRKGLDFTASHESLLTMGIRPSRPDTGYGYIQFKDESTEEHFPILKVKTFTEKPNLEMARFFLKSGEFLWNSGIFLWKASTVLKAFKEHLPDMYAIFKEGTGIYNTDKEEAFIQKAYTQTTNISIDYGIMEKADNVFVALSKFPWSDLGSWASLHEISERDGSNNDVKADALVYDTRNSIIRGPDGKLIVVQGLNGYLVGAFDNVVIVCEKDKEELFRKFVADVKAKQNGDKFI